MTTKKNLFAFTTLLLLTILSKANAQTNLAPSATLSTSYVSPWETLSAVKDNITPSNSLDNSNGAYGNWNGEDYYNTYNYVQYEWDTLHHITSTNVYWWDDGNGIAHPTDAYIQYYSNGAWITAGSIGSLPDQYNTLELNVNTSSLRIYMTSLLATGILEWQVLEKNDESAINSITIQENSTGFCNVDGSVDNNNEGFTDFGFANTTNELGSGIEYQINGTDGIYELEFRYASSSDRPANIFVNNNLVISNFSMLASGSWTSWTTISTTIPLSNGTNNLRIEATTNDGLANIDYITLTGLNIAAGDCNNTTDSDTESPTTPSNLSYNNATTSSVNLSWIASSDNIGVTGYQILKNDSVISTTSNTSTTVNNLSEGTIYSFAVVAYDAAGNYSTSSASISITTISTNSSQSFTWPEYNPTISYNFKDEYGDVPMPTEVLDDCSGIVGTQSDRWWTFRWGASKNALVTSNAITPMLDRLNTDFSYFRDIIGWPPDLRARNGYKSAVYLYGSGLCTDNASNTDLGGWQSAVYYNGQSWPIILASYYPVYSFDPACTYSDKTAQQGAIVHEGIHSVLASMPGVKQAAWFHEGGNTWLQQEADSRRSGDYSSMGFLNAAAMIAPFMPVECYSGWLQDGSFGGPSAEGVNMFEDTQQICTWRNLLGGTQYGNIFPTFIGQTLGDESVAWVWRNCPGRVLEGIASAIGETQIRRLLSEYRAKQAVVDFGVWTNAIIQLLDNNMGSSIQAEWQPSWLNPDSWIATPYVETTNTNGLLTPEARTTPGWSGGNQIPLTVSGNSVTVNFQPIGENMTCQIAYIAADGSRVYSEIVSSGDCSIDLDKAPANDVVIAVITNTDYIFNGESTRTAHYDYRLQLVSGVSGTADIYTRWYRGNSINSYSYNSINTDSTQDFDISKYCSHNLMSNNPSPKTISIEESGSLKLKCYPNPVANGSVLKIDVLNKAEDTYTLEIANIQGHIIMTKSVTGNSIEIDTKNLFKTGIYFAIIRNNRDVNTLKFIVE